MPPWAKLLQLQQDDGRLGLTPSFLVGALRNRPGNALGCDPGRAELRVLLEMMRDDVATQLKVVTIFECQNIVQPVAALSTSQAPGDPIVSPTDGRARLFVWPWISARRPVDIDWLVDALWMHYGTAISTGHFSYSRALRTFHPFDRSDEEFIARAFCDSDEA
jgi:hypothetical protein